MIPIHGCRQACMTKGRGPNQVGTEAFWVQSGEGTTPRIFCLSCTQHRPSLTPRHVMWTNSPCAGYKAWCRFHSPLWAFSSQGTNLLTAYQCLGMKLISICSMDNHSTSTIMDQNRESIWKYTNSSSVVSVFRTLFYVPVKHCIVLYR